MPLEIADNITISVPTGDWRVVLFLVAGAVVSTMLFGLAPALQTTRLELVRTMRGEVMRDARPGRARHALIAVQVGAAALLVICAAVFLRSALAATTADPGIRTSDTLRVAMPDETRRAALLQAVADHPLVLTMAASSPETPAIASTSVSVETTPDTPGAPKPSGEGGPARIPVGHRTVSAGYFEVLDIDLMSGRDFVEAERTAEAGVVVVSETVARQLWPNRNAVGQIVHLELPQSDAGDLDLVVASSSAPFEGLSPPKAFTVVGVVRDVGGDLRLLDIFSFRGVYLPTRPESSGTFLMLRVRGNPEQARQALLESLTTVHPGVGDINTLGAMAGVPTYILQIAFWVTIVLGGLALALTVSGLFSVLSYLVEQRATEIGVRMALGATTRDIATLVVSQSVRPVAIGLIAGGGLAVALAILLTAASSEMATIVRVFDPLAYAASALVIAAASLASASIPALRAARLNPIETLRAD